MIDNQSPFILMIRILTLFTMQYFLCIYALQAQIIVPQHANDAYSNFVQELENENFNIDFTAFRFSYLESPQYQISNATSRANRDLFVDILAKMEAEDFTNAIPLLEKYLSFDYTFAGAHYLLRNAYVGLENEKMAQKHHEIYIQLTESLKGSVSGASCKEAYMINHIKEAYFLIEHLHYKLIEKPTANTAENCEIFHVQPKNEKDKYLHFDVSKIKK